MDVHSLPFTKKKSVVDSKFGMQCRASNIQPVQPGCGAQSAGSASAAPGGLALCRKQGLRSGLPYKSIPEGKGTAIIGTFNDGHPSPKT